MPSPRTRKYVFGVVIILAVVIFLAVPPLLAPVIRSRNARARDSQERQTQRDQILQRVQSIGGWDVLKKDCALFAELHRGKSFDWSFFDTNTPLPAAITALKPRRVEFYPPRLSHFNDSDFPVVRLTMFGAHRTGGRDTPSLGLDVVCTPGADYRPNRQRSQVPLAYWQYRKVADDVYEFF